MNLLKNLSIGKKLLIILLLISILPLFIITYGFYSLGKVKLTEQTIHILKVQAENVATSVHHFIDDKFKHLYKITNIPQLTRFLEHGKEHPHIPYQIVSSLRAKLRIDPDFLSFFLLDAKGNVVLSTGNTPNINPGVRPFFYNAIKGNKYVSSPSLDEGKSSLYFSIPIRHTNKIAGVLVAQCNAEELWKLIETENGRVGSGNAVILSNSDGVRIAHSTNRDLIFKSWAPVKPEVREQIFREKRYGGDIREIASTDRPEVLDAVTRTSPPQYFQHKLVIGKGTYHSAIKVMDNGWRIIATIPESTFLVPVRTSMVYISIISGIITCMVIVASIIIGRLGTKRIQIFASISTEIARGNFTNEIPITNGDEIGQLGKAFNIMTAAIKSRIDQLKYLNDVALEIHSHIDLEILLQDVANISRKLINAEMGALILLDEQRKKIKYFKVTSPYPETSSSITRQPVDNGLLAAIVKRGTPIRLDDVENDPRFTRLSIGHLPIKTLIGVPVKIDSVTAGGLFLANKANNERFTLEDEELLLTLSYQAAVAIENAKLYGEIQRLAVTDGLTGLLNHKEFHRRLNEHIEGSKRYKYGVILLIIDIDHFKRFNDTYGHQTGDFVLKTVSHLIKTHQRTIDTCARYGGEEFVVILRETNIHQAIVLAERLRSTIYSYPFKHNKVKSQLSVSIGIAAFPKDADNAEDLIKKTDEALYMAKESGRNRVFCYANLLNGTTSSQASHM